MLEGLAEAIRVAVRWLFVPRELFSSFNLEFVSGVVVTNAALSWAGFPTPDSPSIALGMGALAPIANDPTADTDGDGFGDYVEVYEKGTDPYLVDSDMDGISDYDEDQQGTDPTNPHSFKQNLTVTVTNTVSLSHAAYLAWGYFETGWEANEVVKFPFGAGTNLYVNASSNGAEYVKAYCDLDGDGFMNFHEYWAGTDPNDATDDGAGTALHAATHAVDDRIADKTGNVAVARPIYENYVYDVFETNLVRNAGCWAADIDLTCTSVRNLDMSYHYGDSATLITPQHVILAAHLNSPIGRQYVFRATNGTVAVRGLIGRARIGGTDIMVGLLDAPLPAEYAPAKLLPSGYERYLGTGRFVPVFHQNQFRQAFVVELPALASWTTRTEIYTNRSSLSARKAFFLQVIGHDSGNPCFMLVGRERILMYVTHIRQDNNYGAPGGPHTAQFISEIQAAIDSLNNATTIQQYSPQFFDFSSFIRLDIGEL